MANQPGNVGQYGPNVGPGGLLVPATQAVPTMASTVPVPQTAAPIPTQAQGTNASGTSAPSQDSQNAPHISFFGPNPNLPPGATVTSGPGGSTGGTAGGGSASFSNPLFNPLAMNLFYQSAVLPMMQGIAQQFAGDNSQFTNMAQQNLQNFQMPESIKSIYGQALPQMAAQQNNVLSSLMQSQMAAPSVDALMNQVNAARSSTQQLYAKALEQQALGMLQSGSTTGATIDPATGLPI